MTIDINHKILSMPEILPAHINFHNLATSRLLIRMCSDVESNSLLNLRKDPRISSTLYSESILLYSSDQDCRSAEYGLYTRNANALAGAVHLIENNIAFYISPEYWGMGYAAEAIACISRAFSEANPFLVLNAEVQRDNIYSKSVLEKTHFKFAGTKTCKSKYAQPSVSLRYTYRIASAPLPQ